METIEPFLIDYGYWVLFLGTLLEGETVLIVAAYLASRGYLDVWTCAGVAAAGTFLGDQATFWIGRRWGRRWLRARGRRMRLPVSRVLRLVHRWDLWFVLGYRFLYGIRNVSSLALGMSRIRPLRFLALNALASVLWAGVFAAGGYFLGKAIEAMLGQAKEIELIVLGGLVAVAGLVALLPPLRRWWKRRHAH